jgi:hypothetical protein
METNKSRIRLNGLKLLTMFTFFLANTASSQMKLVKMEGENFYFDYVYKPSRTDTILRGDSISYAIYPKSSRFFSVAKIVNRQAVWTKRFEIDTSVRTMFVLTRLNLSRPKKTKRIYFSAFPVPKAL